MRIQLSDHFSYKRLLRFVLPSILMIICTSVYSIVDGFFISNFVGKTPFAAINLIYPVLMAVGTLGFMAGTGGSAIVSKTLGEGKPEKANQYFSLLVYATLAFSILISVVGFIFIRPIAIVLGADGILLDDCVLYARILFCSMPAFILQYLFQSFFIAAEKPGLSLKLNIIAGLTNAVLDYLLIAVFPFGLAGAAAATAAGQLIGGIFPIIYFARKNGSPLRLTKAKFNGRVLASACANGSSEMVTN
ncbi:MAG: MATE family efflux transporter, partial [[Clostridium] leptum]